MKKWPRGQLVVDAESQVLQRHGDEGPAVVLEGRDVDHLVHAAGAAALGQDAREIAFCSAVEHLFQVVLLVGERNVRLVEDALIPAFEAAGRVLAVLDDEPVQQIGFHAGVHLFGFVCLGVLVVEAVPDQHVLARDAGALQPVDHGADDVPGHAADLVPHRVELDADALARGDEMAPGVARVLFAGQRSQSRRQHALGRPGRPAAAPCSRAGLVHLGDDAGIRPRASTSRSSAGKGPRARCF